MLYIHGHICGVLSRAQPSRSPLGNELFRPGGDPDYLTVSEDEDDLSAADGEILDQAYYEQERAKQEPNIRYKHAQDWEERGCVRRCGRTGWGRPPQFQEFGWPRQVAASLLNGRPEIHDA